MTTFEPTVPLTDEPNIHPLTDVHTEAKLGRGVVVGPFCRIGPDVEIGNNCRLDSNVVIEGRVTIGSGNRFWPGCVIGGEPQDISFDPSADVSVTIGDDNQFREGVTVHRGADKEDGVTRVGSNNLLMANSHVAHNCCVGDRTYLVNGVLLGGHVHVQDNAIVSGNSVVHHFATIGTLAFVSGGCRVPRDVPPYMLAAGSDNPTIRTINVIGMKRAGISDTSIRAVKQAYRLLYREHKKLADARELLFEQLGGVFPLEVINLFKFLEEGREGRMGRGREAARNTTPSSNDSAANRRGAA